jgi:hypothetical protein
MSGKGQTENATVLPQPALLAGCQWTAVLGSARETQNCHP